MVANMEHSRTLMTAQINFIVSWTMLLVDACRSELLEVFFKIQNAKAGSH